MNKNISRLLLSIILTAVLIYGYFALFVPLRALSLDGMVRSFLQECAIRGYAGTCFKEIAQNILAVMPLKESLRAMQLLEEQHAVPGGYAACHNLSHYLARATYASNKSIPETYASCLQVCGGGCYHGAVEAYFQEKYPAGEIYENEELLIHEVGQVCQGIDATKSPALHLQCMHGLGHSLMFATENDLPKALSFCDGLSQSADRRVCYNGAFMENTLATLPGSAHTTRFFNANDPFYPCNILDKKYQETCYPAQLLTFSTIYSQKKIIHLCMQFPEEYRYDCFFNFGITQGYGVNNPPMVKWICDQIEEPGYRNECIKGGVHSIGVRFGGNLSPLLPLCEIVAKEHKESCYRQIGSTLILWDERKKDLVSLCNLISGTQEREWCNMGIHD